MLSFIGRYINKFQSLRKKHFTNNIMHRQVLDTVTHNGGLTNRYIFMMVASTSIVTIGLITNSAVIVVGSMLISPLMFPIMLFGFSLCTIDYNQLRISAKAILWGILLAITTSFLITKISPIQEITTQILSRTHPNLYDLLIAVFSGAAGVYTIIVRKGEEIIGVALATSILPPLSIVGFGTAIGNYDIAKGAGFLFLTNLLAIAISTTILAKWYGFGYKNSTAQTFWQVAVTISVFIALSIPLGVTLNNIVGEIKARNIIKSKINQHFTNNSDLNFIKISFLKTGRIDIKAVVFTEKYHNFIQENITYDLEKALNKKIVLTLEQVLYEEGTQSNSSLHLLSTKKIVEKIRAEIYFPIKHISVDQNSQTIDVYPAHHQNVHVKFLYETEQALIYKFPGWKVKIHPHLVQIPNIYFMVDKITLSDQEEEKLDIIVWMLNNWEVYAVEIIGFTDDADSSLTFNPDSTLGKRINYVKEKLKSKSITASVVIAHSPTSSETNYGIAGSQKIQIKPRGKVSDLASLDM